VGHVLGIFVLLGVVQYAILKRPEAVFGELVLAHRVRVIVDPLVLSLPMVVALRPLAVGVGLVGHERLTMRPYVPDATNV
jgi:hypothetical protein